MIGFATDKVTGDLAVNNEGGLQVIQDNDRLERIRLVVQSSLRAFEGEVMTDPTMGCKWIEIFQTKASASRLKEIITREVRAKAFQAEPSLQTNDIEIVSMLLNGNKRTVDLVLNYNGQEIVV